MDTRQFQRHVSQVGFSLTELIVVIATIGILSAVAIPNFSGVTDDARLAKQQATLGMLKAAWGTAYAIAKVAPTCAQVVAQAQADPPCTGTTAITCGTLNTPNAVTNKAGTALASFTCSPDPTTSPASISCAAAGC